jgi:hypothetical protein
MFAWLTRLFTPPEPPQPRLSSRVTALENHFDDLESRVEYLAAELKSVRGRQYAQKKSLQDATGETIDEGSSPESQPQQPRPYVPTAHLSRRFRGF